MIECGWSPRQCLPQVDEEGVLVSNVPHPYRRQPIEPKVICVVYGEDHLGASDEFVSHDCTHGHLVDPGIPPVKSDQIPGPSSS